MLMFCSEAHSLKTVHIPSSLYARSVHVTTNAAIVTDILLLFLLNDNTFSRLHVRLSFPSRTVRVGSYRPDSRIPLTW